MTDRHAGYVVTLEKSIREDDAEAVITALRMVKGVLTVDPIDASPEVMVAEARANRRWMDRLDRFIKGVKDEDYGSMGCIHDAG